MVWVRAERSGYFHRASLDRCATATGGRLLHTSRSISRERGVTLERIANSQKESEWEYILQRSATRVFAENRNTEYVSAPTLMILERGKALLDMGSFPAEKRAASGVSTTNHHPRFARVKPCSGGDHSQPRDTRGIVSGQVYKTSNRRQHYRVPRTGVASFFWSHREPDGSRTRVKITPAILSPVRASSW